MTKKTLTKWIVSMLMVFALTFTLGLGSMAGFGVFAQESNEGTVVVDFDNTALTTDYTGAKVQADNIFGLFAGKTGEGKCINLTLADGTPITFTLANPLVANDYAEASISLCTSNWGSGNQTLTAYSVTDAEFKNAACSVNTAYGNKAATLTLDVAKLANAEGKIEKIVIVPTFTNAGEAPNIACFFDDLIFVEKPDPLADGILDFDNSEITTDYAGAKVQADNIFGLFAGKTGEGKCVNLTMADGAPITFTLSKAISVKEYGYIEITLCTSNWGSGNQTLTGYAVADTEYKNAAGSVNTAYGNKAATLVLDTDKLKNADGMIEKIVIVPTFTNAGDAPNIACFFDDLTPKARAADDPVEVDPIEAGMFDFDTVQVSTDYAGTKVNADNIFGLFAGKTGEGKCMNLNLAEGAPITFTLSQAISVEKYGYIEITLCTSNWGSGNQTLTGYAVTDTEFKNAAGDVYTAYGNQAKTLVLDTDKLADENGMIKGFVVVPTFTNVGEAPNIGCFFDDLFIKERAADDPVEPDAPVVVDPIEAGMFDFDGVQITTEYAAKIDVDNVFNIFAGKTGETKCMNITLADGAPITFILSQAISVEEYGYIEITLCTSNWESGNQTLTGYALTDTEFKNAAGDVYTAYGNQAKTLVLDTDKLADENGMIKGFVVVPTFTNVGEAPNIGCFFDDLFIKERAADDPVEPEVEPMEDGIYDFDGVEIKTKYSSALIDNDNVFDLFPGKTGEGKCISVHFANGAPVVFKFAKAISVEDFNFATITICTSNWVGGRVRITVYAMDDADFAKVAGSANTSYANELANILVDLNKLANADGMVEGFVVVPTFTNMPEDVENPDISCFFDDFIPELVPEDDYSSKHLLAGDCIIYTNPENIDDSSVVWGEARKHGLYEPYGKTDSNAFLTVEKKVFDMFDVYEGKYEAIRAKRIVFGLFVGDLCAENYAQFQMRFCFTDWNFGKHQFYIYGSGTKSFVDENGNPVGYAAKFKTSSPEETVKIKIEDVSSLADEDGKIKYIYVLYWGNVADKGETVIGCMNESQFWVSDMKFIIEEDVEYPTVSQEYIEKDIAEILPVGNGATFESTAKNEGPVVAAKTKAFDVLNAKITVNYTENWSVYFLMRAAHRNAVYEDGGIMFWFSNTGVSIGVAMNGVANLTSLTKDELPEGLFANGQSVDVKMAIVACYLEGLQCGYQVSLYLNGAEEPVLSRYFENSEVVVGQYTNIVLDNSYDYSVTIGSVKEDAPTAEEIMGVKVLTSSGDTVFLKPRAALVLEYFELEGNVVSDLVIEGEATYDAKTGFITFNRRGSVTVYYEVTNELGTFRSNELTITYDGEEILPEGCFASVTGSLGLFAVAMAAAIAVVLRRKEN